MVTVLGRKPRSHGSFASSADRQSSSVREAPSSSAPAAASPASQQPTANTRAEGGSPESFTERIDDPAPYLYGREISTDLFFAAAIDAKTNVVAMHMFLMHHIGGQNDQGSFGER